MIHPLPMNSKIVKVFGHKRSGNNFLMASLYTNFYHDQDMSLPGLDEDTDYHTHEGEIQHHNEYGKLFGGHYYSKPINVDKSVCIYIKRNPADIAYSLWKFELQINSFEEFYNDRIELINKHISNWSKLEVCTVHYERLYQNPLKTLKSIADYFHLTFIPPLRPLSRAVGWSPQKAVPRMGIEALKRIREKSL